MNSIDGKALNETDEESLSLWDCLTEDVLSEISKRSTRSFPMWQFRESASYSLEDIAQEAIRRMLVANEKKPLVFTSKKAFLAWLGGVMRNISYEYYRKYNRGQLTSNTGFEIENLSDRSTRPRTIWRDREEREISTADLEDAISKLNPKQRSLIEYRLQGLSHAEVAKLLNKSQVAVRHQYKRAKDQLIRILR